MFFTGKGAQIIKFATRKPCFGKLGGQELANSYLCKIDILNVIIVIHCSQKRNEKPDFKTFNARAESEIIKMDSNIFLIIYCDWNIVQIRGHDIVS